VRAGGYATFALGKWHLTPPRQCAPGSSKARWPLGCGFDRYYGFLGGVTDQYRPELVYDNHVVEPPSRPEMGYHLNKDLAERAMEFLTDLRAVDPEKPFFMYYCPGAGHCPHQVPRAWADRYRGRFDQGWDHWRQQTFERQLEMGIVPEGTRLTPRPEWVAAWDELTTEDRRLFARQMEVYAGFLNHTDHHIGRLVAFLEELGELDNTLLLVTSDNGASSEGGPRGFQDPWTSGSPTDDLTEAALNAWGGPDTFPHYAWGWAWAGNTPLRRWKRYVHEGGIADPLIVHWPDRIAAPGAIRGQYTHVTDIAPTILEALGTEAPEFLDGIPQTPMHGVSFAHTFDDPDAPTRKLIQFYEMTGCRAIWKQGWKAVTEQEEGPELTEEGLDQQRWELYHVERDFSESNDVADQRPDKLRELIDLWWAEAGKYGVLPLDARRFRAEPDTRNMFVYRPGGAPVPGSCAPSVHDRSHMITATIDVPKSGAEGVILAHGGGYHGGYALYVKEGRLHYVLVARAGALVRVTSKQRLRSGTARLELRSENDGERQLLVLSMDGREVGRGSTGGLQPIAAYRRVGLTCGYDGGMAVSDDYEAPFPFTGTIQRVVIEVGG
jgi:arylsulfatase A-like enzyme